MDETSGTKEYEIGFTSKNEEGVSAVKKILAEAGAVVQKEGPVRPIPLAYPISKHKQGYFGFMHFLSTPEKVSGIDREVQLNAEVLRSLITTLPSYGQSQEPVRERDPLSHTPPQQKTEAPRKPLPLSNEALEKKIEEILQ